MPEKYKKLIKHEAGHWVAALNMGLNPKEIQISLLPSHIANPSYANIDCTKNLSSIDDVSNYLRARIITLYAGVYAANFDGVAFDDDGIGKDFSSSGGGYIDFMRITDLYKTYKNINTNGEYGADALAMIDESVEIIKSHYQFIEKVANYGIATASQHENTAFFSQGWLHELYSSMKDNSQ